MKEVRFYEETEDELLDFAVIIAEAEGKLVFCKHREHSRRTQGRGRSDRRGGETGII